ncbi:hypothetical protein T01_14686 [Trichinella spiralis]|uniref:Uncharacterized protein n=1 Tax=Trichinella spiralis TaxID=6334 RepID=A0A0V0Z5I9_TRISP|nr:hypothetical protein T01_14686 [Trichinella spiralis]
MIHLRQIKDANFDTDNFFFDPVFFTVLFQSILVYNEPVVELIAQNYY